MELEERRYDDKRDTVQNICDTVHDHIHSAAVVALDRAVNGTDRKVDRGNDDRKNERETRTDTDRGEDALTKYVRAEKEGRFMTVYVLIVVIIADTNVDRAGFRIAVNIIAGVALDTQAIVFRACHCFVRGVYGDKIAVFVELRRTLGIGNRIPKIGVILDTVDVLRLYVRIDDLNARFILELLNLSKFLIGKHTVNDTALVIFVVFKLIVGINIKMLTVIYISFFRCVYVVIIPLVAFDYLFIISPISVVIIVFKASLCIAF